MDPRVLLIHPYNHMEADAVPVGTVGLVNMLPGKALGRFASEVTEEDVRCARVVLIDVHWFFPLGVLDGIALAIRRLNPEAKIIVGGLASSFYADVFFQRYPVDFVIRGDAEPVFRELVNHLLAGVEPPPLANVWSRSGPPPSTARIRVAEFDAVDWLNIDWFPSYRAVVLERHAMYRSRVGESAPLCYPYLPVTRGCRRSCDFCYGAYHERVFGRGIRMRAPEVLLRDLETVAADPLLAFVSILFADEGLMEPYAEALANRRLELDGFLFFCGNAAPSTVDAIRSGFAGTVHFSVIQAADLAPLPSDPPTESQLAAQRALVAHFERMARTRVVYYHVNQPPAPEVGVLDTRGPVVRSESGKDWNLARPNLTTLRENEGYGAREQLDELVEAARRASAWHLVRLLVPTLRTLLDVNRYRFDLGDAADEDNPIATTIAAEYRKSLKEHYVYGFQSIELSLRGATLPAGAPVGWARPEAPCSGACEWVPALNGFGWEGELLVEENGPNAIVLCPVLRAWDGSPVDLASWARTLVPAMAVPRGSPRTIRFGGATVGAHFDMWIEDAGLRSMHRLGHGLGLIEGEVIADRRHLRGRDISPDCERNLWPAPAWPRAVRDEIGERPTAALTPHFQTVRFKVEPTHLDIELSGVGGVVVALVVFPREQGTKTRYLGSERLAFAYRLRAGKGELDDLQRSFEEALRRADARIDAASRLRLRVVG